MAPETLIMTFLSMLMLLGTFLKYMGKLYGVPYCPTLLFLGMFMGYFVKDFNSIFIEAAVVRISSINAHGILQIFLPIMVFEAAFNMDFHIFKKEIP